MLKVYVIVQNRLPTHKKEEEERIVIKSRSRFPQDSEETGEKLNYIIRGLLIMALTVPPPQTTSFSELGWIFHNNHLDSSIYQDDDDIMEFSDSSAEYQTPPHQNNQQHQQQVSVCKSTYLPEMKRTQDSCDAVPILFSSNDLRFVSRLF